MKQSENSKSLVTVQIVTYNSAQTVLETLQSVLEQEYEQIELVISDDNSTDETVEICNQWLEQHKEQFARTSCVIQSSVNTGCAGNINRAIQVSHGEFYKPIAGDDILLPSCISDNIDFMHSSPDALIVFSQYNAFEVKGAKRIIKYTAPHKEEEQFFDYDAERQRVCLYYQSFVPAPTLFVRAALYEKFTYDEKYKMFEDAPFNLKLTKNGIKLFYFPKVTVLYRIGISVSRGKSRFENPKLLDDKKQFFYDHVAPDIKDIYPELFYLRQLRFFIADYDINILKNKRTFINKVRHRILLFCLRKKIKYSLDKHLEIYYKHIYKNK